MTDPAQRLVQLAEAELQLVLDRRADEIAGLQAERDRALAALPARLTPEQEQAVRQAIAIQHQTGAALRTARDEIAAELQQLGRSRTGVRGYASAGLGPTASVDATG
jgi:hypothetical protein